MRKKLQKSYCVILTAAMAAAVTACSGGGTAQETAGSQAVQTAGASQGTEKESSDAAESSGEASSKDTEMTPADIKFSWWGGDSRHEATEKAVAAFMEKYPAV